jgi:hypothetical protein
MFYYCTEYQGLVTVHPTDKDVLRITVVVWIITCRLQAVSSAEKPGPYIRTLDNAN